MNEREKLLERLTGVQSSRKNYYAELKKTVVKLQKKNMQLEIINDVMKSFNVNMSIDIMLKNIYDKLRQFTSLERISLSMLEKDVLILSSVYPQQEISFIKTGESYDKSSSFYWDVIKKGTYSYWDLTDDTNTNDYFERKALEKVSIKNVLVVPLISKSKVIGVLSMGSKEKVKYDQSDFSFFQQLSDQLAVCLENARLYNQVLRSEKEWIETFRAVSDLIVVVDINQNVLRVNDSVKSFFQKDEQELYKKSFTELFLSNSQFTQDNPIYESLHTKKQAYRQFTFGKRMCECYSYPVFNDKSEMYAFIVYITDVTEKRKIEAQLIQSGKLAAIGEMAAGVAHELNNPLTAILGNAQLLLRKADKESKSYQLLEGINECGKRCKGIIQNLLTFSRQDEYVFQEFSLNDAILQVIGLVRDQIEKQMISLETNLDSNLKTIQGHQQQIGQIILNLVLNAKDALEESLSEKKGIKIVTRMSKEAEQKWILLTVEDNGIGIEEDFIREIFNPFFTTKEVSKGTGLGLSVSIGIAESHGGTIDVQSKVGVGSTFTLKLPVKE